MKTVKKVDPNESIGVALIKNGLPDIVEYSELPKNLAFQNAKGSKVELEYNQGNILNFLLKTS